LVARFGEAAAAAIQQRREQLEAEIESLQGRIAREEDLKVAIDATAAALNEAFDGYAAGGVVGLAGLFGDGLDDVRAETVRRNLARITEASEDYAATLREIRLEREAGAIS